MHIRWMIKRDMPEVLAIEDDSFDSPWPEEEFVHVLRQRNAIGMVVCDGDVYDNGPLLGYMVYELRRKKLRLLNIVATDLGRACTRYRVLVRNAQFGKHTGEVVP